MRKTVKKKLKDFIKDESGKISKGKVLKVGLGTLAILRSLEAPAVAVTHTNIGIPTTPTEECPEAAHTNHTSY